MNGPSTPEPAPLAPPLRQLNRATLGAVVAAAIILVVVVLPAEYGRDPTGIGRLLGLTPMGEMKQSEDVVATTPPAALDAAPATAENAAVEAVPSAVEPAPTTSPTPSTSPSAAARPSPTPTAAAQPAVAARPAPRPATVTLTLQPNEGREVKALMKAGDSFRYSWKTGGPELRYEFHGEKVNAGDDYTSYQKGSSAGEAGVFEATFDGTHGWYWRNRTAEPVTVTVTATGRFETFAAKP